jgi:hypothetical protein
MGGSEDVSRSLQLRLAPISRNHRARDTLHMQTENLATLVSRALIVKYIRYVYQILGRSTITVTYVVEDIRLVYSTSPDTYHILVSIAKKGQPRTVSGSRDGRQEIIRRDPVRSCPIARSI